MKRLLTLLLAITMIASLCACSNTQTKDTETTAAADNTSGSTALFTTPRERLSLDAPDSPEWVTKLDVAKGAKQLFVVAGYERSTAWISMHEKDDSGNWKMILSTPGFIGKEGLGKTKEGDGMTPVGAFSFNKAFGIADDPGIRSRYSSIFISFRN